MSFFSFAEAVQHAAVGEHDFEAEHEIARDAVGERAGAAGIGREIAADGAGAFGAERQRKQAIDCSAASCAFAQRDAGLAGHGVGGGVDLADLVEPRRATASARRRAEFARRPGRYCRPAARSACAVSFASLRIARDLGD